MYGMRKHCRKLYVILILSSVICGFLFYVQEQLPLYYGFWQNSAIQHHRKNIVKSVCEQNHLVNSSAKIPHDVAWQLFVEHKHKFIYCEVPKVGCSNWKRVILLLNTSLQANPDDLSHANVHESQLLRRLSDYSPDMQMQLLNNYTKVMFTRDPLERLVSAYRDKFFHNETYYSESIAKTIIAKIRHKVKSKEKIKFEEFARYIIEEKSKYLDNHWKPMFQLCDPCNIQYDILGKYQTINQDAAYVLHTIRAPKHLKFPNIRHYPNENRANERMIYDYYRKLPVNVFKNLINMYRLDFAMFGYDQRK